MTHQVYVIANPHSKLYIGLSENVSLRLNQHNTDMSRWTKGKGPWTLILGESAFGEDTGNAAPSAMRSSSPADRGNRARQGMKPRIS